MSCRHILQNCTVQLPPRPHNPLYIQLRRLHSRLPFLFFLMFLVSSGTLFYFTTSRQYRLASVNISLYFTKVRLYFISLGIIEPILVTLKIEYRLNRFQEATLVSTLLYMKKLIVKPQPVGWGLTICLWLGPPWFNYWFSFTLVYSRISHEYSSLFIIVINLIFMFSL